VPEPIRPTRFFEEGYSQVAHFADPDGNEFYIIELRAQWQKYAPDAAAA
jgi:hypothetical protein